MKVLLLREKNYGSPVLAALVLNDDAVISTLVDRQVEERGYKLQLVPVLTPASSSDEGLLASINDEIEAYEEDEIDV